MSEELRDLVQNHPRILAKKNTALGGTEGIGSARAGYMPTVKFTGDSGPEYVDSPTRRSTEGERFYKGRETAGLTVTQKLFDGFATDSAVEAALETEQYNNLDLKDTTATVMLAGVKAYLNVLRYSQLIKLARENERKVQNQMNLEDERVQKGAGIASDVLAAKQRLQLAKEARVDFEGRFETASANYIQLFGRAPEVASFSEPPIPSALIPPQLTDAVQLAESNHPTVLMAAKQIAVADDRRRTAEAGYYPSLDLIGKANYENDKNATLGVRRDWSLLLTASWELFSGFKTEHDVAQASFNHAAAKDSHRYSTRAVAEQVRTAWHTLNSARQRTALLDNAAIMAEEVWSNTRKSRDAGKATVREVLDDELRINDARIKYTNAYYDMIQATYDLLTAMGKMDLSNIESVKSTGDAPTSPLGVIPDAKLSAPLPVYAPQPDPAAKPQIPAAKPQIPAAKPTTRTETPPAAGQTAKITQAPAHTLTAMNAPPVFDPTVLKAPVAAPAAAQFPPLLVAPDNSSDRIVLIPPKDAAQ